MSTPYNRGITAIVIHHMGDGLPPEVPIQRRWNPARYDYPEYDYGIEADGTVRVGRPLTYIGSHTQSDKEPYRSRGANWWNKHAIGIGLAGDFTKYPMSRVQFNALVALVKHLMAEYQLSLNEVYPHGQVTYTSCPGCTYSKVPALRGSWSYDEFEKAAMKEDKDVLKKAILMFSDEDYWSAKDVNKKLGGGVAMFDRERKPEAPEDAMKAEQLYTIGGPDTGHPNEVHLSGRDKYDTAAEVGKWLNQ